MAFSTITSSKENVCQEEGTGTFNYTAYGTIVAGQAVEVSVDSEGVVAADSDPATGFVGVAEYDQTSGSKLAVWGPGNKVWSRASGTVTTGDRVQACDGGYFRTQPSGNSVMHGVALSDASDDGVVEIMLY